MLNSEDVLVLLPEMECDATREDILMVCRLHRADRIANFAKADLSEQRKAA